MKTTLFLLILFSFTNINFLNAQWKQCNNCPECSGGEINVDAVWCFVNDGKNIYTGITGGVYLSTDYGDNWTAKNNGLEFIRELAIISLGISGNNIFAGTMSKGIFLSTDQGEKWIRKSKGLPYMAFGDTFFIARPRNFLTVENGIFAGTYNGIYLTTDIGENWLLKNNGLPPLDTFNMAVYSIAISGNNIFAGTKYGIYLTIDNGDNWSAKNKGIENFRIISLAINGNNIYAGTEFEGLFLSTDQGDNWENIGFNGYTITEIITEGNNIIVSGYGVNLSTDNGKSWTSKNSGLPGLFVISMIINGEYIFAGIDNYGIYRAKLSDLGITDVKEPEQTNENTICPNPASDEFRLRFHAPTETTVQLSVFDLLGNCVFCQTLQSTEGTNEKTINCEKLPQGYYYVKININEIVETVPLVVIK